MKKVSKTRTKKRRVLAILLVAAAVLALTFMSVQIVKLRRRNAELEARKARLEQLLNNEELRKLALEDEEEYVKTTKYIEEKAKSIGYVYPDEIIFRKDD